MPEKTKNSAVSGEWKHVPMAQLKKWHRDLDACQKVMWLRGGFDPAYCMDAQDCLKEMESALAAPVPPAGLQPEVLAVVAQTNGVFPETQVVHRDAIELAQVGTELINRAHYTRIQAEVSALQQRLNIADQRVCDLQSELTKALSLIRWFYIHANVHQVGTVMMDAARDFIAHQSAPGAKVCSHIWVSADNRGAGAGEICQACSELRPAAKGSRDTVELNLTEPSFYRNKDND